jgi:hypothetical protein
MKNRILEAYVVTHHADPAGAELRVFVRPERVTPATAIKGRLMGPRSPYANTVEIAYPLRELARTDHILLRVLIPEPNFWQPKSPLLYEGPLELWEGDERCDQITLRHGIRTVQLSERGLRVNGQPLRLQGVCADTFTEADARRWRNEQINFVLTPARDDTVEPLTIADRFGLFVLGRIDEPHHWPRWPLACQRHASFLGCVLTASARIREDRPTGPGLIGAEMELDGTAPAGRFDFIVVERIQQVILGMPTIFKVAPHEFPLEASPQIIGWFWKSLSPFL